MTILDFFKSKLPNISLSVIESVLRMHAEGATVPFMARYRKEQTQNLNEVDLLNILNTKEEFDTLTHRQSFIIAEIEHQGKLTPELKNKILATFQAEALEDLYLPYKQKRKTKATLAKEAGLEPFALSLWDLGHGEEEWEPELTLEVVAQKFLNPNLSFATLDDVFKGVTDILTEKIAEISELRQQVRDSLFKEGLVVSKKADAKEPSKFEPYFDHSEPVASLLKPENSHRVMAMRRGFAEKELSLSIVTPKEDFLLELFFNTACPVPQALSQKILHAAAKLAYKVYVMPSIETEVHRELKNKADEAAVNVFSENIKKVLLAAPFGSHSILGIDPGIRTGCKLAVISDSGEYRASTVIYLLSPNEQSAAAKTLLTAIKEARIQAVAIGNGTYSRETEAFVKKTLKENQIPIPVVVVSESGASIYSASIVAREEFPDLDLTVRGAISIARRLQDPLAELVKVDPKSIGVGQYQHDVNPATLKKSLDHVVEHCVNAVGVKLNTASYHLLMRVSGIGPALAKSIVQYRSKNGAFLSRSDLLKVPRLTPKVFEQAAGFLRIPESANPLDNTGVHPERYPLLENLAKAQGLSVNEWIGEGAQALLKNEKLKEEIGAFSFQDLIRDLSRKGLDPRAHFEVMGFREDIHEITDLKPNMLCPGVVTNVTHFGAFVDIGVHQDGLIHISELSDRFVKNPKDVISVGDWVKARVISADPQKRQIALSLKRQDATARPKPESFSNTAAPYKNKNPSTPKPSQPFNNPFLALKKN